MTNPTIHDLVTKKNRDRGHLCLGLDPLQGMKLDDAREHLLAVLDAAGEHAAAAKPNLAMYLAHGDRGLQLLDEVLSVAHRMDLLTVLDAKWADVHHTMERYHETLDRLGADLVTLNPYLGLDPLGADLVRRAFVVCRTTNEGAGLVQDHGTPTTAQVVAEAVNAAGGGLVLPGNDPERLEEALGWAPEAPLLLPGLGAQGGTADALPDMTGRGVLINVGRGILKADDPGNAAADWEKRLAPLRG